MLLNMGVTAQRLISSITAVVVLLSSIDCMCRGALFIGNADHHEVSVVNQDIDHDHQQEHNEQQPAPCDHDGSGDSTCNHCQASLVSEQSVTQTLSHLFDLLLYAPSISSNGVHLLAVALRQMHRFGADFSLPASPETLLSLGCALTI